MIAVQVIKVVRFHQHCQWILPPPPRLQLLTQLLATPAGKPGASLAEFWLAVGSPGNFSKALNGLETTGWIVRGIDGKWRATPRAHATCIVLVDEVPEQRPDEADEAFQARCNEWNKLPPPFVMQ